jgi:pyridoxal phosphate enzyme (YggS family)
MDHAAEIQHRYHKILEDMDSTAARCSRNLADIHLIAVSKKQPIEKIAAFLQAGGTILGENYPEEGAEKIQALEGLKAEWHMVGHIQSRKAPLVARHFDFIHSLDSLKLAERLQHALGEQNKQLPFLVEINIGAEINKSGYLIQTDAQLEKLWLDLDHLILLSNLNWRGIMIMPPFSSIAEESRPYFIQARELLATLKKRYPTHPLDQLSMGTSLDYFPAIEEGATMVRIGTALFGERE